MDFASKILASWTRLSTWTCLRVRLLIGGIFSWLLAFTCVCVRPVVVAWACFKLTLGPQMMKLKLSFRRRGRRPPSPPYKRRNRRTFPFRHRSSLTAPASCSSTWWHSPGPPASRPYRPYAGAAPATNPGLRRELPDRESGVHHRTLVRHRGVPRPLEAPAAPPPYNPWRGGGGRTPPGLARRRQRCAEEPGPLA